MSSRELPEINYELTAELEAVLASPDVVSAFFVAHNHVPYTSPALANTDLETMRRHLEHGGAIANSCTPSGRRLDSGSFGCPSSYRMMPDAERMQVIGLLNARDEAVSRICSSKLS